MSRTHKYAGAYLAFTTDLEVPRIADLCSSAAKSAENLQVNIRLEESSPGRLVYSVRNRFTGGHVEFMTFDVTLTETDGVRHGRTHILRYKMQRSWPGPWKMMGCNSYKHFVHALETTIKTEGETARTEVVEIVQKASA